MEPGQALAYLAGIVDGDGYVKLTPDYSASIAHPYYAAVAGVQQLYPGEAVKLFASVFGGKVRLAPMPSGRRIMRCEVGGERGASALRRLLPFLLLKRAQAILLLEVARLRPHRRGRADPTDPFYEKMARFRQELLSLHSGSRRYDEESPLVSASWHGYVALSSSALGWTGAQLLAYLAGIMDSDGSFRVEKRRVRDMIGPHYRINIRCAQVAPSPAVELLAKTFGGRLGVKNDSRPNCRDLVTWSLHDKTAVVAIEAVLPYLVVKRAEAYLLLELRRLKAKGKKGLTVWRHPNRWHVSVTMRKRCYTPDQNAEFDRIHRAVQALHSPPANQGKSS